MQLQVFPERVQYRQAPCNLPKLCRNTSWWFISLGCATRLAAEPTWHQMGDIEVERTFSMLQVTTLTKTQKTFFSVGSDAVERFTHFRCKARSS